MTVKKLQPDQSLVVGHDDSRSGRCEVFLCDSGKEAYSKFQALRKRKFNVVRRGSVRDILGP